MEQLQSSLVPIIAKNKTSCHILSTKSDSGYREVQLAAGLRPKPWSVFILAGGRTIITVQSLKCSLCRLFKEACYRHIDVLKPSLDIVQGSESVYLHLSLPMVHYRKKRKKKQHKSSFSTHYIEICHWCCKSSINTEMLSRRYKVFAFSNV